MAAAGSGTELCPICPTQMKWQNSSYKWKQHIILSSLTEFGSKLSSWDHWNAQAPPPRWGGSPWEGPVTWGSHQNYKMIFRMIEEKLKAFHLNFFIVHPRELQASQFFLSKILRGKVALLHWFLLLVSRWWILYTFSDKQRKDTWALIDVDFGWHLTKETNTEILSLTSMSKRPQGLV